MTPSGGQLVARRSGSRRRVLTLALACAACHGAEPPEAPGRTLADDLPFRSDDALAVQPPAARAQSTGLLSDDGTATPSSPVDSTPAYTPPAAAAETEDLVFLVPSTLPEGATVLHIGDSFAGALGGQLNRELEKRGVKGVLEFKTGTYIATWASRKRLAAPLAHYKPDLVLITLGANELDIARPRSRARMVRKLVAALGGRPCVWIAPPLWKGAKPNVLRVIEDNCAPCTYLDSTELVPNLERLEDNVHPSNAGRARWAKAVMGWLDQHPLGTLEPRWVSLEP